MYDDVDIANYPDGPEVVAGYVNGRWATALGLRLRFPGVPLVTIDVNGSRPDAQVLDMEWGDATPAMCPPWAAKHGPGAVIYCSVSRVQEVLDAFAIVRGLMDVRFWTAHYPAPGEPARPHLCDASCGLPSGAAGKVVATQYADPKTSGGQYDVSLTAPGWPA